MRAGGVPTGLVRDLSYCEASFGRDEFPLGSDERMVHSRSGPGARGKDTDYGAQITRHKTATPDTWLLNQGLRSAAETYLS